MKTKKGSKVFEEPDELEKSFVNPPDSAGAYTWWHWMNGNISKEGITADLEAMKSVGIKGFQLFQVGTGIPKGPVEYGSPEWAELFRFTAREAERLDLEMVIHNCPGWSSSGGPWVPAEMSMQWLVWTETTVDGGGPADIRLPRPYARDGYYRDALVIAYPAQPGEVPWKEKIESVVSDAGAVAIDALTDGNTVIDPEAPQMNTLDFLFREPYKTRYIEVVCDERSIAWPALKKTVTMKVQASANGTDYVELADITIPNRPDMNFIPITSNFPETESKYYRLIFSSPVRVSEVKFSQIAHIANWTVKNDSVMHPLLGWGRNGGPAVFPESDQTCNDALAINPESVLDITRYMDSKGYLRWKAPEGNWTVLRMGSTTTRAVNHPAPDGGLGYEVDKYSKEAMQVHFRGMFKDIVPSMKGLAAKGKAGALIDSYEVGYQNWTPKFPEEFKQRRGYDLINYLPAMTGKIVGSAEASERFLFDVRVTHADMMAENYYGEFDRLCREIGWISYIEPYWGGPFKESQIGAEVQSLMGEFWLDRINYTSVKNVASIAHTNGIPIVGAESFTGATRWQEYPYCMRGIGDFMYTLGLNRYVFHCYAHQPNTQKNVFPGMTMGQWGWHFNRTNTWFEQSKSWLEYISRSQALLQQGLYNADLLYYIGADAPDNSRNGYPYLNSGNHPELLPLAPEGYSYDVIGPQAVIGRLCVEDGRIVLPDGMRYRLLILPEKGIKTKEVLEKVHDLVKSGMWLVVQSRPRCNPSLTAYPESDAEYGAMVDAVWGNLDGTAVVERNVGKGKVFWGVELRTILERMGVKPDFAFTSGSGTADINYIHKSMDKKEVYLVANRGRKSEELVCSFRVEGKQPEFWDAATGEMIPAAIYEHIEGGIRFPLHLEPAGSLFVVFRSRAPERHLLSVEKEGAAVSGTAPLKENARPAETLDFPVAMPAPAEPPAFAPAGGSKAGILFWQNGTYLWTESNGTKSTVQVSGIGTPGEISGPWTVKFPPDLGAPEKITLDSLMPLTEHPEPGVKYFSGTAAYSGRFSVPADSLTNGKRLYLDLGRVNVIAEIKVNGKDLGTYWMPPFRVDITDSVHAGENDLEIKVTNTWVNRLIGDEKVPSVYNYVLNPAGSTYARQNTGAVEEIPEWYGRNAPKPEDGRITFSTFKHWDKGEPLEESGLVGPVKLRNAVKIDL